MITLGATRSPIDDIRYIQNTSSGSTGYQIADHLYRHGHDVTCVSGITTYPKPSWLPLDIYSDTPEKMLNELKALSNDEIERKYFSLSDSVDKYFLIREQSEVKIDNCDDDCWFQITKFDMPCCSVQLSPCLQKSRLKPLVQKEAGTLKGKNKFPTKAKLPSEKRKPKKKVGSSH